MVDKKDRKVVDPSAWETETGLVNDVDGWIANPRFGRRDEYAQIVEAVVPGGGLMFLIDLTDTDGDLIGSQGYSVGSGWETNDDGSEISHPKRVNVVSSSVYGQLINQVVKKLGVNMYERGYPYEAKSWNGLGFHWMQQEHATLGKDETGATIMKSSLMPVEFLGERKGTSKVAPAKSDVSGVLVEKLADLAKTFDKKAFVKAALKVEGVSDSDELLTAITNYGEDGFWAQHQE